MGITVKAGNNTACTGASDYNVVTNIMGKEKLEFACKVDNNKKYEISWNTAGRPAPPPGSEPDENLVGSREQ